MDKHISVAPHFPVPPPSSLCYSTVPRFVSSQISSLVPTSPQSADELACNAVGGLRRSGVSRKWTCTEVWITRHRHCRRLLCRHDDVNFTCCIAYSVGQKITRGFLTFPPKRLGIFSPISHAYFTFLFTPDARLQIFIQLPATLTKLCHDKRDHPVHIICSKCPPSARWVVALNMA